MKGYQHVAVRVQYKHSTLFVLYRSMWFCIGLANRPGSQMSVFYYLFFLVGNKILYVLYSIKSLELCMRS